MHFSLDRAIGADRRVSNGSFYENCKKVDDGTGPATMSFPPPEGKKPDLVHTFQTTAESALLYRHVDLLTIDSFLS